MKYATEIWAVDPRQVDNQAFSLGMSREDVASNGKPIKWVGPIIEAGSWGEAEELLQTNGLGYARVTGVLVDIIESKTGKSVDLNDSPWILHD